MLRNEALLVAPSCLLKHPVPDKVSPACSQTVATHPQGWQACLREHCLRHGDAPPLPPALPLGSEALRCRNYRLPAMCGRLASTGGMLPGMNARVGCGRQSAAEAGCVSHRRSVRSAGTWRGLALPGCAVNRAERPKFEIFVGVVTARNTHPALVINIVVRRR